MKMLWLGIAIIGTVGYHLVLKLLPGGVNQFLSMSITFAVGSFAFLGLYAMAPGTTSMREAVGQLNWTTLALAGVIVCLDLSFLMLYRSGFELSLGQLITQSAAALALLVLGVAFFAEKLTMTNLAGIGLCVVGFWLISQE